MDYYIVGGDGNTYGPFSADQIRSYVAEGRAGAQTSARSASSPDWLPLSSLPEFASLFGSAAPPPAGGAPPLPPPDAGWAPPAGPTDAIELLKRAWPRFQPHIGNSIAVVLLFLIPLVIVCGVVNALSVMVLGYRNVGLAQIPTSAVSWVASGIMWAGFYSFFLKLVREGRAEIGDAFAFLKGDPTQPILLGIATGAVMSAIPLTLGLFAFGGFLYFVGSLAAMGVAIFLGVCWMFAFPLVIDRRMGFWDAMEASRNTVMRDWGRYFVYMLVFGVLNIAGVIACLIGALITLPLTVYALTMLYIEVFPNRAA